MLILRKPWHSQPQEAVEIDWGNSVNAGLVFCAPLNPAVGLVDLARNAAATRTGLASLAITENGIYPLFGASNFVNFTESTGITDDTAPITFAWTQKHIAPAAFSTVLQLKPSAFTQGALIGYQSATSGYIFSFGVGGNPSWNIAGVLAPVANQSDTFVIVCLGGIRNATASNFLVYQNDVLLAAPTASNFGGSATNGLRVGALLSGSDPFEGAIGNVRIWNRALSRSEASAAANPLHVFLPRSIFIPTSAGGAGAFTLTASAGSFTLAGQSATLLKSKALGAAAGSFALAGQSANLLKGRTLTADAGAFSLAGQSATLLKSKVVAANAGAFVLAGQAATIKADRKLTAAAGSFALSGQAATLSHTTAGAYTLTAEAGAFTLAGQSATLLRSKVLPAAVGAFSLSGQAATLTYVPAGSYSLTANAGSFTITGSAAQLLRGYRLAATAGAFSLAGSAAGLLTGRRLVAAAAAYAFTGSDATLTHSAAAASYTLSASAGAFALSGVAVTFRFNRQLTGQAGAFVLSGGSATLTNSGAIFTTSEHWRYTFPVDDMRYAMPVDDMRHTFPSGGLTYNFGE